MLRQKYMCLYPRIIMNPKYKENQKNGGVIPPLNDTRVLGVPIGCGKCMECRKQKARNWQVRLSEDIRIKQDIEFVTLTFSNEAVTELHEEIIKEFNKIRGTPPEGYDLDNEIATKGVRRFLERWRKKYKKSVKHWLVTELGHNGTENIHLHGLIYTNKKTEIERIWKYGWVYTGNYVNEQTINYIIKYINKIDEDHKYYNPIVLTSSGIGIHYMDRSDWKTNTYKENKTREYYTYRDGIKGNLPQYYRNKIYSEEEREKLWIEKLNKEERWVNGVKIDIKDGLKGYLNTLSNAQQLNTRLGYGNNDTNWTQKRYEKERRILLMNKRKINTEENATKENILRNGYEIKPNMDF